MYSHSDPAGHAATRMYTPAKTAPDNAPTATKTPPLPAEAEIKKAVAPSRPAPVLQFSGSARKKKKRIVNPNDKGKVTVKNLAKDGVKSRQVPKIPKKAATVASDASAPAENEPPTPMDTSEAAEPATTAVQAEQDPTPTEAGAVGNDPDQEMLVV